MHDRGPNGYHALPTPSPTDIMLAQIRSDLWDMREQMGGLKTGQVLTLDAVKQGFYKIDKAHERITRVQEQHEALEELVLARLSAGPPPTAPEDTLTSRMKALGEVLANSWKLSAVLAWLVAALGVAVNPESLLQVLDRLK